VLSYFKGANIKDLRLVCNQFSNTIASSFLKIVTDITHLLEEKELIYGFLSRIKHCTVHLDCHFISGQELTNAMNDLILRCDSVDISLDIRWGPSFIETALNLPDSILKRITTIKTDRNYCIIKKLVSRIGKLDTLIVKDTGPDLDLAGCNIINMCLLCYNQTKIIGYPTGLKRFCLLSDTYHDLKLPSTVERFSTNVLIELLVSNIRESSVKYLDLALVLEFPEDVKDLTQVIQSRVLPKTLCHLTYHSQENIVSRIVFKDGDEEICIFYRYILGKPFYLFLENRCILFEII
jgi:hypothetical protein